MVGLFVPYRPNNDPAPGDNIMKVELAGPGDLGHWYLVDGDGNSIPLVERPEDHPAAASLFGWKAPKDVTDEEKIIDAAIDFLMEHIGDEIKAPKHVVEFFERLKAEADDE